MISVDLETNPHLLNPLRPLLSLLTELNFPCNSKRPTTWSILAVLIVTKACSHPSPTRFQTFKIPFAPTESIKSVLHLQDTETTHFFRGSGMNSMSSSSAGFNSIVRRDLDPEDPSNAIQDELYSSWALLILVVLLIATLWMSYYLQLKKIRAFHETVVSIFGGNITSFCSVWLMAGMIVGLIIRVSPGMMIQNMVSFKYSVFFNFLLPPIILNSGYELHQVCIRLKLLISGKLLP
jgi:hypothetical protein